MIYYSFLLRILGISSYEILDDGKIYLFVDENGIL